MKRFSLLDACLLGMESIDTPMHVGMLLTFRTNDASSESALQQRVARWRSYPPSVAPFNVVLPATAIGRIIRPGRTATHIDLDYHLRHSALPHPGGERELGVLISRLHSHPLDLRRPPWECHVIEGLPQGRFAVYLKLHRAVANDEQCRDLLHRWMSVDDSNEHQPPPWAAAQPWPQRSIITSPVHAALSALKGVRAQLRAVPELYHCLARATQEYPNGSISGLFKAPSTALNGMTGSQRRFATQTFALDRLERLAKTCHVAVDDVVMATIGGALRLYLLEMEALPPLSLVALRRVSIDEHRQTGGLIVDLETQLHDPIARLVAINRSHRAGMRHLRRMSKAARQQYNALMAAPLVLTQTTGTATRLPPLFNLIVNQTTLSQQPRYLDGAELDGVYPQGLLLRGQALSITAVRYAQTVTLGFTACRNSVPSAQRLAVHAGEALSELEQASGLADTRQMRVVSIHTATRARNRTTG
ncbi:acyltransferase, WS/DGAT/MGAT [Hydrocarboniphaga daqingensis]|uniref:diacylglycerol O-acyltransferase n=1 Tax=Hydrocarboniphaga daqingensis TaxID=490188 RepID=A0A1M5PDF3_9GAMM|nr:wax ester/triacylglycerol synthase family O-acyltransferase [Hydrocarboniphaga daqingensis]SHG99762.1 acyltransferase, WS/DGAT/MGAT [Hydrocarboniphaga daqingensis]